MASEAPELLPCPFCGGEAEWKSGGPGNAFVMCKSCHATTDDGSIPRIRAAWNTRADLHQQALAEAEARGYARAVENVFDKVESLSHELAEDGCSYLDRDEALTEISALSPTPADPVVEAAIPYTPTTSQLQNVCYSMRHDYGLMTRGEQETLEFHAAEAWKAVACALAQKEGE